jgi:hypothetical protein
MPAAIADPAAIALLAPALRRLIKDGRFGNDMLCPPPGSDILAWFSAAVGAPSLISSSRNPSRKTLMATS